MSEEKTTSARLQLSGRVLHDSIEGEVIAIDLDTGTYYSLRGSAAEVWGLLQCSPGTTQHELTSALVGRYQSNGHDVDGAVSRFLDQLRAEGLVDVVEGVTASAVSPEEPSVRPAEAFAAPVLEKHTDMQDLVLIDPVHDVSEAGWPHMPTDVAAADGSGA